MNSAIETLKRFVEGNYSVQKEMILMDCDRNDELINSIKEALLELEKQEKLKVWLEKEIERIFAKAKRTVKPEHDECICGHCIHANL